MNKIQTIALILALTSVDSLRLHTPESIVDPKNIILFSAWQTPEDKKVDDERVKKDMGIRNAVQASTNCYAKANGYTNFVDKVILPKSAPYSHYVKLAGYRQIMYRPNQVPDDEWVMWLDADVRITNFNFKLEDLISRADPDTHVIVTPENSNCDLINDVFLIRNSKWGRRFMHVWDTLLQKGSCTHHDQCPMKLALIQLKRDLEDQSKLSESELDWPDHNGMARVDPDLLAAKPFQKGGRVDGHIKNAYADLLMEHGVKCTKDNTAAPFQFGPVFMVPTWIDTQSSKPQMSTQLCTSGKTFDEVIAKEGATPFTVHAKYSQTWCDGVPHQGSRTVLKKDNSVQKSFQESYMTSIRKTCDAEDIKMMIDETQERPCWASWQKHA